jgi:hypothetical protein
MSVLSYTNAFPGIAAPQHKSGQSTVQGYIYPGALQPLSVLNPAVLTSAMAFLGIAMPQHLSGQTSVRSYLFPGALQPNVTSAPPPFDMGSMGVMICA